MAEFFYAVRKGKTTGIYSTWEDCKANVDGVSNAEYKKFKTRAEACEYLGDEDAVVFKTATGRNAKKKADIDKEKKEIPKEGKVIAYVDGSYSVDTGNYAFGCVFILPSGSIYVTSGGGSNPESAALRNVTGEMLGSMYAVLCAMKDGYKEIEIRYDYRGIEKWVKGEWKANTDLTKKYAASMRKWMEKIKVSFTKVEAHTGVKYNELADRMAKEGLMCKDGVPKPVSITEMTLFE